VEVAKSAIADIQLPPEQEAGPGGGEEKGKEKEPEGKEEDERRRAALDKLENASEDSLLGQASTLQLYLSPTATLPMPANKPDGLGVVVVSHCL
jgi:hypothetical protein